MAAALHELEEKCRIEQMPAFIGRYPGAAALTHFDQSPGRKNTHCLAHHCATHTKPLCELVFPGQSLSGAEPAVGKAAHNLSNDSTGKSVSRSGNEFRRILSR